MKRTDPRHGTYAGYQTHQREGKRACRACLDAHAAYLREFRKKSSGWREQERARKRAMQRLVETHREEFNRLYIEERTRDHEARVRKAAKRAAA